MSDPLNIPSVRNLHEGATIGGEFYQACPFFFTREGATLSMVGQFRGRAAFLMAGGPSVSEIDTAKLARCWTMTLNNAHSTYRGQANCIVDEPSRFNLSMWLDPTIQKFVPTRLFERPLWDNRRMVSAGGTSQQRWNKAPWKVGDCPNVIGYRRNDHFQAHRWLYEDTINWGNHKDHGGGRSVLLASMRILFLLGFRRVYLLGVDLDMSADRHYHFPQARSAEMVQANRRTYAKLQRWFAELQPYFLRERFVVKNCNARSNLKVFPYIPFEEAVDEATGDLGDWRNERTDGMYEKLEDKLKSPDQTVPVEHKSEDPTPETDAAAAARPILSVSDHRAAPNRPEVGRDPMRVELVTHCYRYTRLLRYHLSSIVLMPPRRLHLQVTVCYTLEDRETAEVLRWFAGHKVPNVRWNWLPLTTRELCRRSIGRNRAALATQADWVWFCDCDHWFGEDCWTHFPLLQSTRRPLVFPRSVLINPNHEIGDKCIAAADLQPGLLRARPEDFVPMSMDRAIGGIQIAKGAACRELGYLNGLPQWQEPAPTKEFLDSPEDVVFRRSLGGTGKPVDIPGIYRIRHSKAGRFAAGARL